MTLALPADPADLLVPVPDSDLRRYRVQTVGPWHIEVIEMMVNWRVHTLRVESPNPMEWSWRYWCYPKGPAGLLGALLAAAAWDGSEDTEPVGWVKAWDGRRDGEGPVSRLPWHGYQ